MEQVHVGDVLVVGAGAVGLMLARALAAEGMSVCVVDRVAAGGHQSNHSHGYLHRGHIYHAPEPDLVRLLCAGSERWKDEFARSGTDPETDRSILGFTNQQDARAASTRWHEFELDVRRCEPGESPVDPGAVPYQFSVDEPAYDVTGWLRHTLDEIATAGVRTVRADVRRIEVTDGVVEHVVAAVVDTEFALVAGTVVVAAGPGTNALVRSALGRGGMFQNRRCYMAVVEHPDLSPFGFVTPDHRLRGLFGVTRTRGDRRVLLVSDYQAFAPGDRGDLAPHLWSRAIERVVLTALPWLETPDTRIGAYLAEKGEVRRRRAVLNRHLADDLGISGLLVGSPSKLTLCPLLVDELVTRLRRSRPGPGVDAGAMDGWERLEVAPEAWTRVPMRPLASVTGDTTSDIPRPPTRGRPHSP